ncbi:sulfotransferase [Zunongwangia sp. F363]|uniref:Sulfotransferase n=1 Tax=Autumnicola tepida TaxID=3075595 RepID=A0ABU3C9R2_9FLAO|nr:sulfotransferase [Zunongwangia sp. F363]MDT0643051.1 sulfotransferase [Zunongwangia sp. F363]
MKKNNLKSIKKLLVRQYEQFLGNDNYVKFVVVASPRTGSNFLISLLSSHRNVYAYGELFNKISDKNCRQIWDSTFSKKMPHVRAVGFKIFYDHPLGSEDREVWELINKNDNIRIIHLVRDNTLRSQLSLLVAYKTNIWGLTPTMHNIPLKERKVKVDVEKFIGNLHKINDYKKELGKLYKEHPYYELSYEALISNVQGEMDKLFEFLDVPQRKVKSNLRKQNPENISELIENYEEFRSKIKETEFACFLKD